MVRKRIRVLVIVAAPRAIVVALRRTLGLSLFAAFFMVASPRQAMSSPRDAGFWRLGCARHLPCALHGATRRRSVRASPRNRGGSNASAWCPPPPFRNLSQRHDGVFPDLGLGRSSCPGSGAIALRPPPRGSFHRPSPLIPLAQISPSGGAREAFHGVVEDFLEKLRTKFGGLTPLGPDAMRPLRPTG